MDKPTKVPRGPSLNNGVKRTIGQIYDVDRSRSAKQVMAEVQALLLKSGKALKPNWPKLSAVQKELTRIRDRESQSGTDDEDRIWSVANLDNPPVAPDALLTVLEVMIMFSKTRKKSFTCRHAKWVIRFYRSITDIKKLTAAVDNWAEDERITKLTGIEDDDLMKNALLYATITGKTVVVSLPIFKSPVEIKPEESELFDESTNTRNKEPYIVEVKET
jgi:hypothetical protein